MSKTKEKQKKKLRKVSANPVEIVSWEDHWAGAEQGWHEELSRTPMIIESAGMRIYEDKAVLQISPMIDPQGSHGSVLTILKKCITKRRTL